jgi:hypothetical protein
MNRAGWLVSYAAISLVSKLGSFIIAFYITPRDAIADLLDFSVGGALISIAFVHVLPRAEDFVSSSYPFASLVALIVFGAVTMLTFVRDAIALMDENILNATDIPSPQSHAQAEFLNDPPGESTPRLPIAEYIPTIILYVAVFVDSVATGLVLAITDVETVNLIAPVQVSVRFLEFLVVGRYLMGIPARSQVYWVFGVLISLGASIPIAVPVNEDWNRLTIEKFAGYTSAVVFGLYVFFGALSFHGGFEGIEHKRATIVLTLFLSFGIPGAIPAGIR